MNYPSAKEQAANLRSMFRTFLLIPIMAAIGISLSAIFSNTPWEAKVLTIAATVFVCAIAVFGVKGMVDGKLAELESTPE